MQGQLQNFKGGGIFWTLNFCLTFSMMQRASYIYSRIGLDAAAPDFKFR